MTKEKGIIFGNIKERILQVGDYYEIGRKNICELIGMTYGNFTGKAKDTPINSIAIQNIIARYPMIDVNWLLTGQGEMLRSDSNSSVPQQVSEPQSTQYSEVIALLKEQLKDKEAELKELNQEIGVLKHDNRKLMEQVMGLDVSERKSSISPSQSPPKDAPSVIAHL